MERTRVRTEKTRIELGPENLVKVTFNGSYIILMERSRLSGGREFQSRGRQLSRGVRL